MANGHMSVDFFGVKLDREKEACAKGEKCSFCGAERGRHRPMFSFSDSPDYKDKVFCNKEHFGAHLFGEIFESKGKSKKRHLAVA